MELQGINRYPVLARPGDQPKHKLAPVQFVRAQPQDLQTHYVALGSGNTVFPKDVGCQKIPVYYQDPRLDFTKPMGQFSPQIQQNPGYYVVPQQQPMQMQANYSPEGYYIAQPAYYVQHATNGVSNEYYTDASNQMTFTQQPENPAAPTRLDELEAEAANYKGISCLFKGLLILSGLAIICISIAMIMGMMRVSPCQLVGRSDTRFCSDSSKFMTRHKGLLAILLVLTCIGNLFYRFALKAYTERRAKAMNGIFYVFAFFFVMSIVTLNPFNLLLYGYMTRTTNKLRKIFLEMEAIKAQGEPKVSETTTTGY